MKKYLFCNLIMLLACGTAIANERIISIGAGITELLTELGAQHDIIAVDSTSRRFAEQQNVPILGYQRNLSTEGILSRRPTLVIGSEEMGPKTVLAQLKQANIKIQVLKNTANDIEDLHSHIRTLAALLDKTAQGKRLLTRIEQQQQRIQALQRAPVDALFLMLADKQQIFAGGSDTTVNGMLNVMRLNNLAGDKTTYFPYSVEAVLQQQPKVLLISERSLAQNLNQILQKHPFLSRLSAVQNQCVFTLDGQALLGGFNLSSLNEAERITQQIADNPRCH
ncbi:hypothetical protein OA57_02395 [Chelonobacter oris]|uniref:Fe/B12 periplasmic-binding domain-containing protein n=1 Tax=Chelonobacter oris TaxID=505317 RepID=A0A0A3AP26_9PAST|nr:ABC transporter substrate-binding protein [Chelonobacter oris]KGQ71101.1 hypothetical protein OA57_02395 [Chelonobacter oris]